MNWQIPQGTQMIRGIPQNAYYGKSEADNKFGPVAIEYVIDGGGSAITTGVKGYIEIPFNMRISGWVLLADQMGSIVVDVWKQSYANFPPSVSDSITGSDLPTLASAQKNQNLTVSSWTTTVASGDILAFNVNSASGVQRITLSIIGTKV